MRRRKRSCTFNSQHSQTFQYLRAKINQWIPKELLKVLQNSKQNPNHQHQQNSMRATGTLFCVFTSLIPPFPTELPWGSTWSTGEEQVPTVIQVQQGHPAFLVGANSGGGTKPGAEGAHAAQGRQLNTPLQRKVMLPSSTTHPSPFGEHVCSPAVSFLFKQLVSVGSWGKKIILLWARQDAQESLSITISQPFFPQMGYLSRYGDSCSVLGGSHRSETQLFPSGFPAAGTVSAFLNPHGRAVLLSQPECCCSFAPSPKTPETISTLLEVTLRDVIDPAVKAMSRSSGATAEQKGHNN